MHFHFSITLFILVLVSPILARGFIALILQEDLYYPHPLVQDILWTSLDKVVEPILMHWPGKKLREKALRTVLEHVHYEDENTRYICIGPVNKVYIMGSQLCFTSVKVPLCSLGGLECCCVQLSRRYDYLSNSEC